MTENGSQLAGLSDKTGVSGPPQTNPVLRAIVLITVSI